MKAYAEGRLAAMAMVNQGQDMIVERGTAAVLDATHGQGMRIGAFAAGGGGKTKYETGSHIDITSQTLLAGIGLGNDTNLGRLSVGGFFEAGWGNYTTKNDFANLPGVRGKGETSYYGGGAVARLDTDAGLYLEGSGRMGRLGNSFNPKDMQLANGEAARIETGTLYYGAHGGVGVAFAIPGIGKWASLDLSARGLWTRMAADSPTIDGARLQLEEAESLRGRAGGRLTVSFGDHLSAYAGGYFEREFAGTQKAKLNGYQVDDATLEGDTVIAEAGVTLKPSPTTPLFIDVSGQGYQGVRTGLGGTVQMRLEY
jgi:outer membrane autotransporter protein